MDKNEIRLKRLEERRDKINAELQRIRSKENKERRRLETRKKVLIGAMILNKVEDGQWTQDKLIAAMDKFLARDNDREVFGLPPRPAEAATDTPSL